jgi:hypothetical protein
MLVEAVRLRREGAKLASDEMDPPLRAYLRLEPGLESGTHGNPPRRTYSACLSLLREPPYPGESHWPMLHGATVTRINARGMVIAGTEIVMTGGANEYRQAWACRPVFG